MAAANAAQPSSSTLTGDDIRTLITKLKQAARDTEALEIPAAGVDRIQQWESVAELGAKVYVAVGAAVTNTDATIAKLKLKTDEYASRPQQSGTLGSRIEKLQRQSELLSVLATELQRSVESLKKSVERLKADPEVKELLKMKKIQQESDAALTRALKAIPDKLRDNLP
ncbi:MAG: hypothetical protein WCT12_10880 [Verrucomicrobiota bacterium]